jgi:phosphoribosylanthranilate isomerase
MRPFVKICGITRLEDAEHAIARGADALGFVFWPGSPRAIAPDRARAIAAAVPSTVIVGVFVNQTIEEVSRIAQAVQLDAIQLHGNEGAEYAAQLKRPVLKAIGAGAAAGQTAGAWPGRVLLLLDAVDPERHGGTGRTVDWPSAAVLARHRPVMLAGGLRPGNVAEAIQTVQPFGIDVSSGVESCPGKKDPARLKALFEAIDAAITTNSASGSEVSDEGRAWLTAVRRRVGREAREI